MAAPTWRAWRGAGPRSRACTRGRRPRRRRRTRGNERSSRKQSRQVGGAPERRPALSAGALLATLVTDRHSEESCVPGKPTAEYSVPAEFELAHDANLTDGVFGNASDYPDHVIFDRKVDGAWQPVTAKTFAEEVRTLAAGLIASGVGPGERVAVMSSTR